MCSTQKLLSISTASIAPASGFCLSPLTPLTQQLIDLLSIKNGFYSFESALHVYPTDAPDTPLTLKSWNSPDLWRREYGGLADGPLFFAQDAFGDQFCISNEQICLFRSETADLEPIASSIEDWATLILADYEVWTGYSLIHEWQQQNGPIPNGCRLVPKIPFILGGKYELQNLSVLDCKETMELRGHLARQIHDLPDGSQIQLRIDE